MRMADEWTSYRRTVASMTAKGAEMLEWATSNGVDTTNCQRFIDLVRRMDVDGEAYRLTYTEDQVCDMYEIVERAELMYKQFNRDLDAKFMQVEAARTQRKLYRKRVRAELKATVPRSELSFKLTSALDADDNYTDLVACVSHLAADHEAMLELKLEPTEPIVKTVLTNDMPYDQKISAILTAMTPDNLKETRQYLAWVMNNEDVCDREDQLLVEYDSAKMMLKVMTDEIDLVAALRAKVEMWNVEEMCYWLFRSGESVACRVARLPNAWTSESRALDPVRM